MHIITIGKVEVNDETFEFAEERQAEIGEALEIGVSVLNRVKQSHDMDFIKAQLDNLVSTVTQAAGAIIPSVKDQFEKLTDQKFNPNVPASYPEVFGKYLNQVASQFKETIVSSLGKVSDDLKRVEANTSESESSILGRARKLISDTQVFLQAQFEGKATDSLGYQIRKELEKISTGIDGTVRAAIEEKLRLEIAEAMKPVNEGLIQIREIVAKESGKAEVFDLTSQKGFAFEDILFERLQEIAEPFGDRVEHTGLSKEASGSQKGDFLYTTSQKALIVIEAKDKPIGLRESIEYMKKALEARGSRFGILVAKSADQLQKQIGRWNVYDNILICCADDIELSVKHAKIVLMSQSLEGESINAGSLQVKIGVIQEEMKKFATIKTQLTNMQKGVGEGSDRIGAVIEEMKKSITAALQSMEAELSKALKSAA